MLVLLRRKHLADFNTSVYYTDNNAVCWSLPCIEYSDLSDRGAQSLSVLEQNLASGVGCLYMKRNRCRIEILSWAWRKGKVTKPIPAADKRCTVPFANHLFSRCRHVMQ